MNNAIEITTALESVLIGALPPRDTFVITDPFRWEELAFFLAGR
jgi:hypothetical protein